MFHVYSCTVDYTHHFYEWNFIVIMIIHNFIRAIIKIIYSIKKGYKTGYKLSSSVLTYTGYTS